MVRALQDPCPSIGGGRSTQNGHQVGECKQLDQLMVKQKRWTCKTKGRLQNPVKPYSEEKKKEKQSNTVVLYPTRGCSSRGRRHGLMTGILFAQHLATSRHASNIPKMIVLCTEQGFKMVVFFSCIAGQVRDMVGQQLEWACDRDQISPKKETNNQPNKNNKTSNTHTQAKARARQISQGKVSKWSFRFNLFCTDVFCMTFCLEPVFSKPTVRGELQRRKPIALQRRSWGPKIYFCMVGHWRPILGLGGTYRWHHWLVWRPPGQVARWGVVGPKDSWSVGVSQDDHIAASELCSYHEARFSGLCNESTWANGVGLS